MMWTLLTLAVLCASPAQGELLATETRVNVPQSPGHIPEFSGSWRFVSIDTKSGNLTAKSSWSVRPPWGKGSIAILEGVVNGELLVQKESSLAILDHESDFRGYATWKRGNLNLPGSPLVFPNASGQPQMLSTFGVPGAMWAVHDTTSIHSVNGTSYTAHTFELSSISDSAKTSLTHLATLGPYGGVIDNHDGSGLWASAGTMPLFAGEHAYHVTGDADNAYVMFRYDKQNKDLEIYQGYAPLFEFYLWRVPTNTSEAPINKTFLNNNITIPCFEEFEFIFKKPNGDGKLLVVARSNCNKQDTGDRYWVMYEIDIEVFDSPTNTSWGVRADSRKGWKHPWGWGPFSTYDAKKEVLYNMGFLYKYDVYATDLSKQDVTTKDLLVINDPEPVAEPGTTYTLSGLAFMPDSEGVSSVYV